MNPQYSFPFNKSCTTCLAMLIMVLCFAGCGGGGQPAGDYTVFPVEGHEDIYKNFFAGTESSRLYVPAEGQHFVVANRTKKTAARINGEGNGDAGGQRSIIGWLGDSALAEFKSSTAPGKKKMGKLYVGPKSSGDYEFLEFTSNDDASTIAKAIGGRPLVVQNGFSFVPYTLMSGRNSSDPAVIEFLTQISDNTISLFCLTTTKDDDGDTIVATIPVDPKETFRFRCHCAFGAWVLSDGKEGEALAKLMLEDEGRAKVSGKGGWDLFELQGLIRQHPQGKIADFLAFNGPVTEELIESEAQAIENIFRHFPDNGQSPFERVQLDRYDLWSHVGLPLQFRFNRVTPVGQRTDPSTNPLFTRLRNSEVKALSVLMNEILDQIQKSSKR